jgi:hypothetical protein
MALRNRKAGGSLRCDLQQRKTIWFYFIKLIKVENQSHLRDRNRQRSILFILVVFSLSFSVFPCSFLILFSPHTKKKSLGDECVFTLNGSHLSQISLYGLWKLRLNPQVKLFPVPFEFYGI